MDLIIISFVQTIKLAYKYRLCLWIVSETLSCLLCEPFFFLYDGSSGEVTCSSSSFFLPKDGLHAMSFKIFVTQKEMSVSKESPISAERTGMWTSEYKMSVLVYEGCFSASRCSP